MTIEESMALLEGIKTVQGAGYSGFNFSYALSKTRRAIENDIRPVLDALEPAPDFLEYENKRLALCDELGVWNEKRKLFVFGSTRKEFDGRLEELKGLHQKALEARDKVIEEYGEKIKEPSMAPLHKIKKEDMPGQIAADHLHLIIDLID